MGQFDSLCMNCFSFENKNGICTNCSFDENSQRDKSALPIRTVLNNRYIVGNVKLINDAVIKYYAFDIHSETKVCITEYFPKKYCNRDGLIVQANLGFEQYYNPNKFSKSVASLKGFNNLPSFVPILNSFAQNRTYYVVTAEYECLTLKQAIKENGPYKWSTLISLIYPVLATVSALNTNGIFHLGLSYDNLLLCNDDKIRIDDTYLWLFRTSNSENIPFISSDGFTSLEQYKGENTDSFSDVYSLCAVIFYALSGIVPEKATLRVNNATLTVSSKTAQNMTKHVISVLSTGLNVQPANRYNNVEQLISNLFVNDVNTNKQVESKQNNDNTDTSSKDSNYTKNLLIIGGAAIGFTLFVIIIAFIILFAKDNNSSNDDFNIPSEQQIVSSTPSELNSANQTSSFILNGHAVADYIGKPYSQIYKDSGNYIYFSTNIKVEHRDDVAKGVVIEQKPSPGTILEDGSQIELTISLGPEKVAVGDYKAWTLSNTVIDLLEKGFENIKYEYKTDITIDGGKVIGTSIPANEKASIYDQIIVYINDFKHSAITSSTTTNSVIVNPNTSSQQNNIIIQQPQTTTTSTTESSNLDSSQ